jgi:hypothetical protein
MTPVFSIAKPPPPHRTTLLPVRSDTTYPKIFSMDDDDESKRMYFVYTGQPGVLIPRDVIHVKVHPSVEVIDASAFFALPWLATIILGEGLYMRLGMGH